LLFKHRANLRKLPKILISAVAGERVGRIRHDPLAIFPNVLDAQSGTRAALAAWSRKAVQKGIAMLGKIAGALLGKRIAGRHSGAKGAMIGYGAAALARRSVPALAAVSLAGWAFSKWRERKNRAPHYPSEASPSPPSA
jgi:hypothetical protein